MGGGRAMASKTRPGQNIVHGLVHVFRSDNVNIVTMNILELEIDARTTSVI